MRLAVDLVIFTIIKDVLNILMIKRGHPPFQGEMALPGGAVNDDESVDAAAARELQEETGVKNVFLEQLYTFGAVDRDPRNRVVSVSYYALVPSEDNTVKAGDDAAEAFWLPVKDLPKKLAFDHAVIIKMAVERLKGKVVYTPVAHKLLPKSFTLTELQKTYETLLEKKMDKRNFRKYVVNRGLVRATKETINQSMGRPAKLFSFNEKVAKNMLIGPEQRHRD